MKQNKTKQNVNFRSEILEHLSTDEYWIFSHVKV